MSKANSATVTSETTPAGVITTTTTEGGDSPSVSVTSGAATAAINDAPAAKAAPKAAPKDRPFAPFEAVALSHITRRERDEARDEVISTGQRFEIRTADERDQLVKMNAIAAPAAKD